MKGIMIFLLISILTNLNNESNAQSRNKKKANKDTVQWHYEIECVGIGVKGTYIIKVWSYSKDPDVAIIQAKKNAVHGVIFKGFGGGLYGCTSQKPLTRNPNLEKEKKSFFKDFFSDGGKYMKYVNLTNDGLVLASDRLKISRKEYKIGVIVSINKDNLRKDLESAGIIKSLTSGF